MQRTCGGCNDSFPKHVTHTLNTSSTPFPYLFMFCIPLIHVLYRQDFFHRQIAFQAIVFNPIVSLYSLRNESFHNYKLKSFRYHYCFPSPMAYTEMKYVIVRLTLSPAYRHRNRAKQLTLSTYAEN